MLRHLSTFTRLIALVALLALQTAHATELEWHQTKVEIQLSPGEKEARAEFKVTNKGKETVHIDRIKTSCGCTGSILDQKSIEPDESATIVGTFNKGNRQGLNQNRLQVFLKGQPEPVETLYMIVKVPRLIDVKPPIVYWYRNSPQTERQIRVSLDTRYVNKISDIEYDSRLLTVTQKADPDGGPDYILHILPNSFAKQLRQRIRIKAVGDDGMTEEKVLQVFVQP